MIDLIIPYYNNIVGLERTIQSIDTHIFDITIIDDASELPLLAFNNTIILRLEQNSGPGIARQYGIDNTHNPYIMFLDTGDVFTSPEAQRGIAQGLMSYPDANVIHFTYFYKDQLTKETDNRMHGKVYKRSFLEKYGITFAPEASYMNEDVGFNRACRLCTAAENQPIPFINIPVAEWIEDKNSLTQKDNQVKLYKDQTAALSLTTIHTIDICRKNNIDTATEINQIAIALYYWYIRTCAERPEYKQDAQNGAKIFYKKYKDEINLNTLILGNGKCVKYRSKIDFPINILKFYKEIII